MANITEDQYKKALIETARRSNQITDFQKNISVARQELEQIQNSGVTGDQLDAERVFELERSVNTNEQNLLQAQVSLNEAQAIVEEFENQPVIPSDADRLTLEKYENSSILSNSRSQEESGTIEPNAKDQITDEYGRPMRVPFGAMPVLPKSASTNIKSLNGNTENRDTRVKIRVPSEYLTNLTRGGRNGVLRSHKGIIFPYTPQVSFQNKADYAPQNPIHSNYTQYFYQRSSVSEISISGKFSVANEDEAEIYVSTVHLLRALTKMKSGGLIGDPDSGSPPPVCRLDAYGAFMLQNVPVAISMFKIDLPDNVDYYTLGKRSGSSANTTYEMTSVPVLSTISISCIPMYSRAEMQKFSVSKWLNDKGVRKAGFL